MPTCCTGNQRCEAAIPLCPAVELTASHAPSARLSSHSPSPCSGPVRDAQGRFVRHGVHRLHAGGSRAVAAWPSNNDAQAGNTREHEKSQLGWRCCRRLEPYAAPPRKPRSPAATLLAPAWPKPTPSTLLFAPHRAAPSPVRFVMQVCATNRKACIVIRSLSDLAGGDADGNQASSGALHSAVWWEN